MVFSLCRVYAIKRVWNIYIFTFGWTIPLNQGSTWVSRVSTSVWFTFHGNAMKMESLSALFFLCCWFCIGAQLEGATPHWAHLSATINNCPIPQHPQHHLLHGNRQRTPKPSITPRQTSGEKERVGSSEGFLLMWMQPLKQTGLNVSQMTALHGCVCCA